jgi:hypothetical protein
MAPRGRFVAVGSAVKISIASKTASSRAPAVEWRRIPALLPSWLLLLISQSPPSISVESSARRASSQDSRPASVGEAARAEAM